MQYDYDRLSAEELQKEYSSLHKKLILPNIFIIIISLVAAVSLLLGAWLDVSVPVDEKLMDYVMSSMTEESGEEPDENTRDLYEMILKNVDTQIRLTITPEDILTAGFSSDESAVDEFLGKVTEGLTDAMETVARQIAPSVFATLVVSAAYETVPEDFTYADLDISGFTDTIGLLSEQNAEGAKNAFLQASSDFASRQLDKELTPENLNDLSESFDAVVEQITVDGEIDFLALFSDSGDLNMASMFDEISAETKEKIALGLKIAAVVVVVCAGLWALLALLALLHILLKNKKVGMWYVKLTGLLPFLICMGLPWLLFNFIAPKTAAASGKAMPALTVIFGGYTFISAICLVALWIVSIFLCHPVKKKIKRCKQALGTRG